MKKHLLFICAIIAGISLTAFGYLNYSNTSTDQQVKSSYTNPIPVDYFLNLNKEPDEPDFFYEVDSRFIKTITKEDLQNAKYINDIFTKDEINGIESFWDVNIVILPRDENKFAKGKDNQLNPAQLKLLQSTNYSTDFCIEAFCNRQFYETGTMRDECFVYYITIVPENEVEFKEGQQALIDYLKKNSQKEVASIDRERLEAGKLRFVVSKDGKIGDVALESTSGYSSIDDKMLELITNLPGAWEPAKNSKGKKVDQELIFSFGMVGC